MEQKVQSVPVYSHSHTYNLPTVNTTPAKWDICYNDKPSLTHHDDPDSMVYIRVYSWYCIVRKFGQMYNHYYNTIQNSFTVL